MDTTRRGAPTTTGEKTVTILHLSDIQFGVNHRFGRLGLGVMDASFDTLLRRVTDDLDTLRRDENLAPDLVALTGDIAEWGLKREYEEVLTFCQGLARHLGLGVERLLVVPGNHDVNRKKCEAYFANCEGDGERPKEPWWPKWEPFARFFADLYGNRYRFTEDQPWTLYEIPELSVVVAGLNSTMRESHKEKDQPDPKKLDAPESIFGHYGWLGEQQLAWFKSRLEEYSTKEWLRVGLVHHNAVRAPTDDDHNLRDVEMLKRYLGKQLNLLLHGHTHHGRIERLGRDLPVISTGSAAVTVKDRPPEVPNQYQIVQVHAGGFRCWARQYLPDRRLWTGDTRVTEDGSDWRHEEETDLPRTRTTFGGREVSARPKGAVLDDGEDDPGEPRRRHGRFEIDDLLARVQRVAALRGGGREERFVRRLGAVGAWGDHLIVTERKGRFSKEIPVGVVDGALDSERLATWVKDVHEPARQRGFSVHSELVIAGLPPEEARVREARQQGVELYTFTEYQGLIDFSLYVREQTERLERDAVYLPTHYIQQRMSFTGAEVGTSTDAVEEVIAWLTGRTRRFSLLLGEFGVGKTFLMHEAARRLGRSGSSVVPLLIDMRELHKARRFDELIAQHLTQRGVRPIDLEAFHYMLGEGMVALLFDGFDELATRLTYDQVEHHFATLREAAEKQGRVVITSRTQHFFDSTGVERALLKHVKADRNHVLARVDPFLEEDIVTFLTKRFDGDVTQAAARFELLREVRDLLGLSHNPRMLGFIADIPEDDLRAAKGHDGRITSATLYRLILDRWLNHEHARVLSRGGTSVPSVPQMHKALCGLAVTLWGTAERAVAGATLGDHVAPMLTRMSERPSDPGIEAHTLGSGTLLVRDDDGNFSFLHLSVLEWLVASQAVAELDAPGAPTLLARAAMSDLMADFFWGLATRERAIGWARAVLKDSAAPGHLVNNATKVLARLRERSHGGLDLRGRDLRGEDVTALEMYEAQLDGADLRGLDLSGRDLRGASLAKARLSYANLRNADLTSATLDEADFSFATLDHATLHNARFDRSQMLGAKALSVSGVFNRTTMRHVETAAWSIKTKVISTLGGASRCNAVAWSPDGLLLATAHNDGMIRVWDATRGFLLHTLEGHTYQVLSVAWSCDGTRLASGSSDKTVRLWEVASGKAMRTMIGHTNRVLSVAWSPDGTCLASGSYDKTVRLWKATDGKVMQVLEGHTSLVLGVAWSPDGTRLASGSYDKSVRLWEATSGEALCVLEGHTDVVISVAWNSGGTRLASGSSDTIVCVWDAANGKALRILEGHRHPVRSVAWSPDDALLASGSDDRTVRLWEADSGKVLRVLEGHGDWVRSVAWSPDSTRLASGSDDKTARVWEVAKGNALRVLEGHSNAVASVMWSPDETRVASGSSDKTVCLWEPTNGKLLRVLEGHTSWVLSVAWSPDGARLASASDDETVRLWEVASDKAPRILKGHTNGVMCVAWSPDGTSLASGSSDKIVRLWEAASGKALRILEGHRFNILSVTWSPDGASLASGSSDKTVRLWDAASGKALGVLEGHTGRVQCVAWSPDGTQFASGSDDKTVRLWAAGSGKAPGLLEGHNSWVLTVAWNSDGTRLASGSYDKTVRIWEAASGKELVTLRGHLGPVNSVSWRRGGRQLISAGDDGTLRLWDATTGECLAVYVATPSGAVVYRPRDGRYRLHGGADGRVWHTIGLARYELGELDEFVEGGLQLADDEPLLPPDEDAPSPRG